MQLVRCQTKVCESMRSVCGTGLPYDPGRRWKKKALHQGYATGMFLKDMGLCRLRRTGREGNGNAWRGCHYAPEATKTYGSGGWTALYNQGPWWHHWHRKGHRHKGQLDGRREDVDADEQGEESKVFGKEGSRHCISSPPQSKKKSESRLPWTLFLSSFAGRIAFTCSPQFHCVLIYLMWWVHL